MPYVGPRSILTMLALSGFAATSVSAEVFRYDHNGSTMRVESSGKAVRILYEIPKPSLRGLGIQPGTVLFDGALRDGRYLDGMSRVFSRECDTIDYFVYGEFQVGSDFTLNGAAPVRDKSNCRIVDNTYEGSNANLHFTALGSKAQRPVDPQRQPAGLGCVAGIAPGGQLNMRVGPDTSYGIIGRLQGSTCGIAISQQCRGEWCLAQYQQTYGWVSMTYIQQ